MAASVWKGHLTFGLVTIPVRLFSAARSETISFNMLHKDDHSRIRQVTYCQLEDKPIARSETVKGYEYEKDHYVVVEDEEIRKVAPKTAKVMEILEFVKADQVDPIYLESSYYVAPEEGGEKAYALLFTALKESGYYALAKVAMHNREHIIVMRPGDKGIVSHTMYFQDEIRQVDE
ncbi:MAG TPA: Ku protein, partial [Bryobacteraceae bacterium]|nr:Ku protein [Bryobacteraceae bacterium]